MHFDLDSKLVMRRSHSASLTKAGFLIIGVVPEKSLELEINEEWVSFLICLLDGKKSIREILIVLNEKEYIVEPEEVIEAGCFH